MSATTLLHLPPPPPSDDRAERARHFDALLMQVQSESRLRALWQEQARIARDKAVDCDERDATSDRPVVCDGWPSWGDRFRQEAEALDVQAEQAGRCVEIAKAELRRIAGLA